MFENYFTEAEALDGYMDEGYLDDLAFKRKFNNSSIFTNSRVNKNHIGKNSELYLIIQNSRKDDTSLMLVDRRKSKKYWWTHDFSIALKGNKKEMKKVVSKLKKNSARIIPYTIYFNSL